MYKSKVDDTPAMQLFATVLVDVCYRLYGDVIGEATSAATLPITFKIYSHGASGKGVVAAPFVLDGANSPVPTGASSGWIHTRPMTA